MRLSLILLVLTAALTEQATKEVEITAEPHHRLVFENAQVRVFNVDVAPHTDTLLHRHRHDYLYVTLGDSEVVNAVQGKDPVTVNLQDGQTGFLTGGYAHIARNVSNSSFRNVTVELLQDDKLRHSTFQWDATRGLNILRGGTAEILFVKDGIRVTEFELQPGGVVPTHQYTGPHLLVAVTDFDIRSNVEGTGPTSGPTPGHFMTGQVKWLPGGYSQTITNTGKTPAKFVTLEFPPLPR